MNNKIKLLSLNGVIAALYVMLTMINPLSYGALQFRVSTMILPLVMFYPNCSIGLIIGTAIANFNSSLGLIDVFIGIIICSIYCLFISKLKNRFIVTLLYSLDSGILVALELYYCFRTPIFYNILTVGASGFIIHLIGTYLMEQIYKRIGNLAG